MTMPRLVLAFGAVLCLFVPAGAQTAADEGRAADAAAIRAHIEAICQAFVDWDVDKIRATHTDDWRGFLENSRAPIKGIDEYMRANGIPWPPPADAPRSTPHPDPTHTFKVGDFDVHFYGADLAVATFFVDFGQISSVGQFTTGTRYRIMDVYARRNGAWNQAASHTVIDPAWRAARMTEPATLPSQVRDELLAAREAVWRAYFTNDQAQLDKLVPSEAIALDGPVDAPFVRKPDIVAGAKQAGQRGTKLLRLEFPQTEMQVYGSTAILYTTYVYELEDAQGTRESSSGKATEIFVHRNGGWVNTGWHLTPAK